MSLELEFNEDTPFDYSSLEAVCGESKQIMVYGFRHCGWNWTIDKLLSSQSSPFYKVFFYTIGDSQQPAPTTLEGTSIVQVPTNHRLTSHCKTGITNLVFTNYIRKQNNLPPIPLIFLIDRDRNPYPLDAQAIAGRALDDEELITHKELRHCYKLCTEFDNTDLKQISEVARETIKFVKLVKDESGKQKVEPLKPLWERTEWKEAWEQRLRTKQKPRNINWRFCALKMFIQQIQV